MFLVENALTLLVCVVGCYLTIRYVRFPFVSLGLLLLIAAFRTGGLGASLMSLCFGLMVAGLWILGIRPIGLDPTASTSVSLLGLPVIALLATLMPPIAVGLGSDARRATARALRVSERRFRESMEHSPIGMLISDLNGNWAYTNIALQQMLGYTAEEFRALPPGGPSKAEDWQESEVRWRRLLSGEIDFYDVVRSFQHKDGHWVWANVDEVIHLLDPQSSKAAANLLGQSVLHAKVFRRERACLLVRADGTVCHVTDVVSPVLDTTGLVSGMVIVFHDATLDVDRTRDLQHRAMHDPLTGLSNRAEFEQRLRAVFDKARHLDQPAAVMAIDLDRFKTVNDAAGHAAGDAVLCKVAEACRLTVRSSDIVARLGGDEFAIILDNCAEDRARHIGQQLLQALNPLDIQWGGSRYTTGASIGLAMNTTGVSDEKAWLENADKACYDAKRHGRGRLRIAMPIEGDELPTKLG